MLDLGARDPAGDAPRRGAARSGDGLDFTLGFVDRVVRPEDDPRRRRAASTGSAGDPGVPALVPAGRDLGGGGSPPAAAGRSCRSPARRCAAWSSTSSSTRPPTSSAPALSKLRADGARLNLNLLGEAVLGEAEADRRLAGHARPARTRRCRLRLDQGQRRRQPALDVGVRRDERPARRAPHRRSTSSPLASDPPKFINLDMEEYRDLDLTIDVFTRLLDQPRAPSARGRHRAAGLPARRARRRCSC